MAERQRTNTTATLPAEYEQCKKAGQVDAWKLNWKEEAGTVRTPKFRDSDGAKWIEAAAYTLAVHPDRALERRVDRWIDLIASAQQPDGYLNSYFSTVEPQNRWTNLRDDHELYCMGHLMEAAVAYYEATGKRKLLDVMCRCADHIAREFGPGKKQKRGYCGHPEVELALVRLYQATGEQRYLDQARFFIDERGARPHYFDLEAERRTKCRQPYAGHDYYVAHLPVREQKSADGHAVRAVYLYCGMADVAMATGDRSLMAACRRLWKSITRKRMYLHGGIGSEVRGERFTFDYDLPNESAYAETCASIAMMFFARRMLHAEGDGEYADVLERALYNGVLSGISLDGTRFFYDNYLASQPGWHAFAGRKEPERQAWFGCACCPPNIARLLASLGGYLYSESKDEIRVDLYAASTAQCHVSGRPVQVTQRTNYPWDGEVRLELSPEAPAEFTLSLRIPGWCGKARLKVNGRPVALAPITSRGYASIRRRWQPGDVVELALAMPVERVWSHPRVRADAGRVALQRGPVVYCLEEADNGKELNAITLPRGAKLSIRHVPGMLGGVTVLRARARRLAEADWEGALYRATPPGSAAAEIHAIPYFAWANRKPGEMLVWLREPATTDRPSHRPG